MGLGRELGTQGSIPLFLEERVTQLENGGCRIKTQACWPSAPCAQPQAWISGVRFSLVGPRLFCPTEDSDTPGLGFVSPVSCLAEPSLMEERCITPESLLTKAFNVLTKRGQLPGTVEPEKSEGPLRSL